MQRLTSYLEQTVLASLGGKTATIFQSCLYGLAGGLGAVAFLYLTNLLFASTFVPLSGRSLLAFVIGSFAVITTTSLAAGLLLQRLSPDAAGSGIPQLKVAFWKDLGCIRWRPTWVKFAAGVLCIGGGQSLGREGPTVYMSGGFASSIAARLRIPRQRRRSAAAMGAAAGLSAAFNTPLAAITFVLEEVVGDLNSRFLGSVLLSSVLGAFVVYSLVGRQPAFPMPAVEAVSWTAYLAVPVVACAAAAAGLVFQRTVLRFRGRIRRLRLPGWLKPCVGGWIAWALGCAAFAATGKLGVFGLGYEDLSHALRDGVEWKIAATLVVFKLAASTACYAWGGCGGIFAPSLFIGGMTGMCAGGLLGGWLSLDAHESVLLAGVGMSACFGALVRAPLTAILMIFEMTHQFAMLPALMLGVLISQALARRLGAMNFYDAILDQDGHELVKIRPPRDMESWQNLPVATIANPRPIVLRSLAPEDVRAVLDRYPYQRFPVVDQMGRVRGVATRAALVAARAAGREPELEAAIVCSRERSIKEASARIIDSVSNIVVVEDPESGAVAGVLTVHDLMRAQASLTD
ncbi:MAG TPA: chloride channel protein [Planctomycetes bacterium]|nr:chloride channel protein [Planctomycetota bacterium]